MKNQFKKILFMLAIIYLPTMVLGWGSTLDQSDNTHKRIARQAAQLLAVNLEESSLLQEASQILLQHLDDLQEGSEAPDYNDQTPYYIGADMVCKQLGKNCQASGLYNDHFYDGDTHQGLNLSSLFTFSLPFNHLFPIISIIRSNLSSLRCRPASAIARISLRASPSTDVEYSR